MGYRQHHCTAKHQHADNARPLLRLSLLSVEDRTHVLCLAVSTERGSHRIGNTAKSRTLHPPAGHNLWSASCELRAAFTNTTTLLSLAGPAYHRLQQQIPHVHTLYLFLLDTTPATTECDSHTPCIRATAAHLIPHDQQSLSAVALLCLASPCECPAHCAALRCAVYI